MNGGLSTPVDKSLFYYGLIYHWLFDPQLTEARELVTDFIPEGSSILDIACGNGQLCSELKEQKHCRVVGLDLSLRMLDFAPRNDPSGEATFVHGDATCLDSFREGSFDFATILMLMHELPGQQQVCVLKEALRVARRIETVVNQT